MDNEALEQSYHGIAARLDRLSEGPWQSRVTGLLGALLFCDCLDQYVGSGILASLLETGWSTVELNAICVSGTMLGYLVGSVLTGLFSDLLGRRPGLVIDAAIFSSATLAAACSSDMYMLIALRFIMGIGLGGALVGAYCILGEYTTPRYRGRHSAALGLIANFSPPLGALMTMGLIPLLGWRAIYVIIAIFGFAMTFLIYRRLPESPRWLASRGKNADADAIVHQAEKESPPRGFGRRELDYEKIARDRKKEDFGKSGLRVLLQRRNLRRLVGISCALFAMNTLVYTIVNLTPQVFMLQGMQSTLSLGLTTVILLGAPFGILMLMILADKHSRKGGMVCCLLALAACAYIWSIIPVYDVALLMIFGFALCALLYYYSLLACSIYLGELFPTQIRVRGAGLANAFGRIAAVFVPYIATSALTTVGIGAVYLFSAAVCLIAAGAVALFCDETRYRTLEDINDRNS